MVIGVPCEKGSKPTRYIIANYADLTTNHLLPLKKEDRNKRNKIDGKKKTNIQTNSVRVFSKPFQTKHN